jgi:hypothetical protein
MTTDDHQRVQALLAERSSLIAQRDRYAQDLADLLRPARAVRTAANVTRLPLEQDQALAGALEELTEVLRILDDEQA